MRAHIRGAGLVLGLVITVFGGPAAWADSAANGATNEVVNKTVNFSETVNVNEPVLLPAAPSTPAARGDQDAQMPRGAPETGDGGQDADGGQHLSLWPLALGMALGATAGGGAIAWREVRR